MTLVFDQHNSFDCFGPCEENGAVYKGERVGKEACMSEKARAREIRQVRHS